ncbi:nickel pincer cofactor biosynthesis protein LarB [Natrinema sp. 74]|uniref:nickel pincer cofactor biosynthesis protein LarB n=1 Tax=Natrinema sp. 74 TaxID=3384159 RepID=UPI0038D4F168
MRELLEAVADGSLSPAEAEAELNGYVTGEAGRFDAARDRRRGVPEAIFADGKSTAQVVALAETALETTDRALLTRVSETQFDALETLVAETVPNATIDQRGPTVRITTPDYERPPLEATVGIATGGTVDEWVADEAELVCEDAGVTVDRVDDIGVAALSRTLDQLERLREADVLIVAAGREGALPTVIAGLVDTPVIGVPVASGYGHAGDGEAALAGMLQSCTVLSVVNIDAGFVAGAQATLIARAIDAASD